MPRIGSADKLIQKIAVLYIIVWSISPPLEIDMIYRLAALAAAGVWAVVALGRGLFTWKIHVYAVLFALAVVFIAYIEKGSFDAILSHIAIYILVVCAIINVFYEEGRWGELKGILPIVLILLIVFNWKTADILLDDHTIARLLVRDDEEVYQYLRQGIGGYSLIYPQVCISPAIFAWVIKSFKHNKIYFAIGAVWAYTYIICIMRAGYSIAIFATVVGAIVLLLYRGRNATMAILIAFVVFASALLLIMNSSAVRGFLLETFDGTAIATKINDLMGVTTEEGGEAGESIQDRIAMYESSIKRILGYPFIGALWNGSGGGHSAILDMFAKYGLWGGYVFVSLLFYVPHYYKKKFDNKTVYRTCNAVTVTIMFVGLLDSMTYSFMPMILLVLPLALEDIFNWEGISNEDPLGGESDTR